MVGTKYKLDLEALLADSGTVDFNKGLSNDKRKERSCKKGIFFGRMGADYSGAPNMSEKVSLKTTNPGVRKNFLKRGKKEGDDDTLVNTIFSFSGNTTVAQKATKVDDDDGSLSSYGSGESMGLHDYMDKIYDRENDGDEDGDGSHGSESSQPDDENSDKKMDKDQNCDPPNILRVTSEAKSRRSIAGKGFDFPPSVSAINLSQDESKDGNDTEPKENGSDVFDAKTWCLYLNSILRLGMMRLKVCQNC